MPIEGGFVGMVDREHFDEWLRKRAADSGAIRRTGTFSHIARDDDGTAMLHYETRIDDGSLRQDSVRARAVIGAAAMLGHEIKNPLSGIRGAAQLLAAEGAGAELTTLITTEVDRIAALIDKMQDFTGRQVNPQPTNIYPLLDHARRVAQTGFARDITIEESFDPSLPPVLADNDALLQIVINLLKNAAEALDDVKKPRILISTAYRHGLAVDAGPGQPRRGLPIELCVIDNGAGAPADIADHLFSPFVSSKPEGQGLGLALVDKLVRDMGGIVQYSREGAPEMTIFRILLARAQ
jgi:two-component system nitrogen regulation sensor histidine kinase GlnL